MALILAAQRAFGSQIQVILGYRGSSTAGNISKLYCAECNVLFNSV